MKSVPSAREAISGARDLSLTLLSSWTIMPVSEYTGGACARDEGCEGGGAMVEDCETEEARYEVDVLESEWRNDLLSVIIYFQDCFGDRYAGGGEETRVRELPDEPDEDEDEARLG